MSPDPSWEEADVVVEAIIGWRTWRLDGGTAGPVLAPAGNGRGTWPARERMEARCRVPGRGFADRLARPDHRSPEIDCTCGVYASDSLRSLIVPAPRFPPLPVIGTVALWGRVIEHARGWRAEFAYPDRLRLICGMCLAVGEGEGIPSRVVETVPRRPGFPPEISPLCRDHLGSLSPGTRIVHDAADVQDLLLSRYAVDLLPLEAIMSVFQRAPVPGPVPYRFPGTDAPTAPAGPTPIRPAAQAPMTARTPTGPPGPTRSERRARVVRRLKAIGDAIVTVVVWVVFAWWGCSDMFVTVEAP